MSSGLGEYYGESNCAHVLDHLCFVIYYHNKFLSVLILHVWLRPPSLHFPFYFSFSTRLRRQVLAHVCDFTCHGTASQDSWGLLYLHPPPSLSPSSPQHSELRSIESISLSDSLFPTTKIYSMVLFSTSCRATPCMWLGIWMNLLFDEGLNEKTKAFQFFFNYFPCKFYENTIVLFEQEVQSSQIWGGNHTWCYFTASGFVQQYNQG